MDNWFDCIDFNSSEFLDKLKEDSAHGGRHYEKKPSAPREHARVRNAHFKQALVRRFLRVYPGLDFSDLGFFCNPRKQQGFTLLSSTFLNANGDVWKYRGGATFCHRAALASSRKDKTVAKLTNRRIRHAPLFAVKFSECKKLYGPHQVGIW